MPNVVLCDDHPIFVEALGLVLARHGMTVSGTVTTTAGIVAAVERHRPDAVVIDRHFGDDDGIDMIGPVLDVSPGTRVLVLTADPDPQTAGRALDAGASGFLRKTSGVASLVSVIARVVAGETVVDVADRPARPDDARRLAGYLTARERECLALIVDGHGSRAIAERLGVSTGTVRTYVQAVLTKLGVHSRLEAASFAVRHSLLGRAG
jgi:two-component system nitrate/nitrite response regulator NarL